MSTLSDVSVNAIIHVCRGPRWAIPRDHAQEVRIGLQGRCSTSGRNYHPDALDMDHRLAKIEAGELIQIQPHAEGMACHIATLHCS